MIAEQKYIEQFDTFYPGISIWFKNRVLDNDQKIFWSARHCANIAGLVIIDMRQGKLCHLSLAPEFRNYYDERSQAIENFLYNRAMDEFKIAGISSIFAHGHPAVIKHFLNTFSNWKNEKTLGNFGRSGEGDILIKLDLNGNSII